MAATACISGPPCIIGKTALSIAAACSASRHTIMPPRGPRSTLCVVKRDDVGVRHRAGDRLAGDQADEVRRVDHEDRADLVGDVAEGGEVDQPRDRRAAADDHLGPVLAGQVADLVVVDELGLARRRRSATALNHLPEKDDLRAVGQVAAVRQRHRQDGVAGLQERAVDGEVGAGARVRLQVGVLGAEQLLAPARCRSSSALSTSAQPP